MKPMKDFTSFIIWMLLLIGYVLCHGSGPVDESDFEKLYKPVPGTGQWDHVRQNILYELESPDQKVLGLSLFGVDEKWIHFDGHFSLNFPYPFFEANSTHFVFASKGNTTKPGLAAVYPGDFKDFGYIRYMNMKSRSIFCDKCLVANTRTAFNPIICVNYKVHYKCEKEEYLRVRLKRTNNCPDTKTFHLHFSKDDEGSESKALKFKDNLAILASENEEGDTVQFRFRPVIANARVVIKNLSFLQSPADIVSQARDVALGVDEVILNHGSVTFTHEVTKSTSTTNEATVEAFVSLSGGFTVSVEASVGFEVAGNGGSVTAGLGFGFSASDKKTTTTTTSTTEKLIMTQKITVEPNKRVKSSSFVKVVPKTTIGYVGTAKVSIYWNTFDPLTNAIIPRLAPIEVAKEEILRSMGGFEVLGEEDGQVLARFHGSVTAEHGIATVFSAENI